MALCSFSDFSENKKLSQALQEDFSFILLRTVGHPDFSGILSLTMSNSGDLELSSCFFKRHSVRLHLPYYLLKIVLIVVLPVVRQLLSWVYLWVDLR